MDWRYLVIHCTDSPWGNVESIRRFHVQDRGFEDIGYHFVVTNCFPDFEVWRERQPDWTSDGVLHAGRGLDKVGAHALGYNDRGIGIALVGTGGQFTGLQMQQLLRSCRDLCIQHEIGFKNVIGHYETGARKTCPDIDMDWLRSRLRESVA